MLRLLLLCLLLLLNFASSVGGGDLLLGGAGRGSGGFIFNGGWLVVLRRSVRGRFVVGGDATLLLAFEGSSRWSARLVVPLSATLDTQGLSIGEFDLDILLLHTGQFAVQLVGILDFLDIEARLERAEGREAAEVGKVIATAAQTRALVGSVVVEETEQRGEFAGGEAWEGKHCSDWGCLRSDFDDSVSLRELVGDAVGLHVK